MQNHEYQEFAENKGLTSSVKYDTIRHHVHRKETPMVHKTDRKLTESARRHYEKYGRMPMATAWIDNQHRVIFDIREIRRGKNKGKLECWNFKGNRFQKVIIPKSNLKETL